VIWAFLFGLRANLFALPGTKCHFRCPLYIVSYRDAQVLWLYTQDILHYVVSYEAPTVFCKPHLVPFVRISHIVMFCSMGVESSTTLSSLHFVCFPFFFPLLSPPNPIMDPACDYWEIQRWALNVCATLFKSEACLGNASMYSYVIQHHLLIPDLCHVLVKQGAV